MPTNRCLQKVERRGESLLPSDHLLLSTSFVLFTGAFGLLFLGRLRGFIVRLGGEVSQGIEPPQTTVGVCQCDTAHQQQDGRR